MLLALIIVFVAAPTAAAAATPQVFTMSVSDRRAVIGTSNRHIWVYDMRSLAEPEQRRVSSLKFQTRCVRVFPDQEGYAVGSVEGRVAVEYFDTSKVCVCVCVLLFLLLLLVVSHTTFLVRNIHGGPPVRGH